MNGIHSRVKRKNDRRFDYAIILRSTSRFDLMKSNVQIYLSVYLHQVNKVVYKNHKFNLAFVFKLKYSI